MSEPDEISDEDTFAGGFAVPPEETLDLEAPAPEPAPLPVADADDPGEQVVAGLAGLWRRAQQIQDQATELLEAMGAMREIVLALSSEGLARRELEERLAVLEAERDVLARQLGKVRRENEEDLVLARERIRALETEVSIAAERAGQHAPETSSGLPEIGEAGADIDQPVVEKVGARARREALKSRPPRPPRTLPPPPTFEDGAEPSGPHAADRFRPDDLASLLDGGGAGPADAASPFSGLLDAPWGEASEPSIDVDLAEGGGEGAKGWGSEPPSARSEALAVDTRLTPPDPVEGEAVDSLQDLLASYLDEKS